MTMDLRGRNFLKEIDFTAGEFLGLIDLSEKVRIEKHIGTEAPPPQPCAATVQGGLVPRLGGGVLRCRSRPRWRGGLVRQAMRRLS
jgi:hypothetical protein